MEKKNNYIWLISLSIIFFLIFIFWWLYLQINKSLDLSIQNQIFSASYGVIALWGGLCGLYTASKWGGLKSVLGKAISFLSFGLLAQVFGQIAYSFYTYYFKIQVPYPSWGDLGYFSSMFFYMIGLLYLGKASGVTIKLKSIRHKFIAVIIPAIILGVSYWLFLRNYQFDFSNPLKIFLDFGYPLGESIYIAIALLIYLLSQGVLGGLMKPKILTILLALVVQFAADYSFLYISYYGNMHPGGINDLIYLIAYYFMGISFLQLLNAYYQIKKQ